MPPGFCRVSSAALCALMLAALGGTGAAAAAAAAAPASAAASSCTLALEAGQERYFSGCSLIDRVGEQFHMLWKTEMAANDPTKLLLTVGLNGTIGTSGGYLSVGFPSKAGKMTDATAMILQTCAAGSAGCTGGAKLVQWYMSGLKQSDVKLDNRMPITNIQAGVPAPGYLAGSFQIEVPSTATGADKGQLLRDASGNVELIFAVGNLFSDGIPRQHFDDGHGALPLLAAPPAPGPSAGPSPAGSESSTAGGSVDIVIEGTDDESSLKAAHAWLGVIGWGVLVPAGIVMARSFKNTMPPMWFHAHRILLALGFVMGTICLGLGFDLKGGWQTDTQDQTIHRDLGMACTILGATQFSAIILRPAKGHKLRLAWELYHHWAALIAIANIYWGFLYMWDLGVWTWASYSAVLAVIALTSVAKDGSDWIRARRQGASDAKPQACQAASGADVELACDSFKEADKGCQEGTMH